MNKFNDIVYCLLVTIGLVLGVGTAAIVVMVAYKMFEML